MIETILSSASCLGLMDLLVNRWMLWQPAMVLLRFEEAIIITSEEATCLPKAPYGIAVIDPDWLLYRS